MNIKLIGSLETALGCLQLFYNYTQKIKVVTVLAKPAVTLLHIVL